MKQISLISVKDIPKGIRRKKEKISIGEYRSFPKSDGALKLLEDASACWDSLARFRKNRSRNRRYYRGDQWKDRVVVNGKSMTEQEYIESQGRPALKQNLISPPIKNILGQFRSSPYKSTVISRNRDDQAASEMMSVALESVHDMNSCKERDAGQLREFLISGAAVYYTGYIYDQERQRSIPKYKEIDINKFFQTPHSTDICGEDLDFIGDFFDTSVEEIISMYAKTPEEAIEINNIFASQKDHPFYGEDVKGKASMVSSFLIPDSPNRCRVFRICRLEGSWKIYAHDYLDGSYQIYKKEDVIALQMENAARAAMAEENGIDVPMIEWEEKYVREWMYYHITANGHCLFKSENPFEHKNHPYVVKFHPMLDGEVWGMVDDMIDQQRMINRMIILQDFIISASAKGVLLVPEDCVSDDFTLEDIAEEWTRYNGVIKIKLKPNTPAPQQLVSNNIPVGINDMINMQMKFMNDIHGVSSALQGKTPASGTPSSLYQQEASNAQLNILDYLESFSWFLQQRDYRMIQIIKQYYNEPMYIALAGKNYSQEARNFDPQKIKNIDFDNTISKSTDTATMRFYMDEMLHKLLENQFISIEMFLEHSSYPFSDKLLETIKAQKEQLEKGIMPDGASMTALQQQAAQVVPQSTQQGLQNAKKLYNAA